MSKTVADQIANLMPQLQLAELTNTVVSFDLTPEVAGALYKAVRCGQLVAQQAAALKVESFEDIARFGTDLGRVLPPWK